MSYRALGSLSFAVACAALLCATGIHAQSSNPQTSNSDSVSPAAASIAEQMVPAQAVLDRDFDARKTQTGQPFRATLSDMVQLKNGPELPRGTALVGKVTTDHMQRGGQSTLAIEFTQAEVKDGKKVPIEATIIGISAPETSEAWSSSAPPQPWNGKTLQVDQVGVLSGVDLHSRIAGENSAVFVSAKKDDVKLAAQSQLALAIGPQTATGTGGGI